MNKPNLFILGAAKSGTTSLYHYLKQHPDIYMSPVKEPAFFTEDFQAVDNPIRYFRLFDDVSTETVIGEASHAYLTSPSTAPVLRTLFPDARFVVILRNPADRAFSLYHHMRRAGYEQIGSFERALEMEEQRVTTPKFRTNCPQYYYNFLYYRSGLYGEQLQRYTSLFARSQFHILTMRKLKEDPRGALASILCFLGLRHDLTATTEVHNQGSTTARSALLQYLWNTKVTHRRLRRLTGAVIRRVNLVSRPRMKSETRQYLLDRYETDQELLRQVTGRDLRL